MPPLVVEPRELKFGRTRKWGRSENPLTARHAHLAAVGGRSSERCPPLVCEGAEPPEDSTSRQPQPRSPATPTARPTPHLRHSPTSCNGDRRQTEPRRAKARRGGALRALKKEGARQAETHSPAFRLAAAPLGHAVELGPVMLLPRPIQRLCHLGSARVALGLTATLSGLAG